MFPGNMTTFINVIDLIRSSNSLLGYLRVIHTIDKQESDFDSNPHVIWFNLLDTTEVNGVTGIRVSQVVLPVTSKCSQ